MSAPSPARLAGWSRRDLPPPRAPPASLPNPRGLPASRAASIMPHRRPAFRPPMRPAARTAPGYHALVPELPDVTLYVERLAPLVVGETLQGVRLASPFLLRSVEPPLAAAAGRRVDAVRRLGKRIVLALEGGLFLVLHLLVAGRLRVRPAGGGGPRRPRPPPLRFP